MIAATVFPRYAIVPVLTASLEEAKLPVHPNSVVSLCENGTPAIA